MIIKSIHVMNFRSIHDETLECSNLTALVGANGAGKSSFLHALELFYSPNPKVDADDYYGSDTSDEIVISLTFIELSNEARDLFSSYMQGDTLTVERVFTWDGARATVKWHGSSLQNAEFLPVRKITNATDKKVAYETLRQRPEFSNLPKWQNQTAVVEALRQWESANQQLCIRQRDDGQFFGFKGVGQGYLGRFTRFLFIPAVRDASEDASEGRGSVLTDLMDLVVRSILANKEALVTLRQETQERYKEVMDPGKLEELSALAERLTGTLRTFAPNTSVQLNWLPLGDVDIPLPKADVKLVEDGYSSTVGRTGHGLQRAFILTMLQHLAVAQVSAEGLADSVEKPDLSPLGIQLPNLVLAIEEPELYQHPSRQRHLAKILMQLAGGKTPGVAERTQILYGTHSPLFVGIDRIDQVRLLRKVQNVPGKPKITKVVSTDLNRIAEELWKADGQHDTQYTGKTLIPRLRAILTPWMSEGFFADVVVLVEGEDDRAAILGVAEAMGHDLESIGFAVIPCGGKTSLDRPLVIFRQLGIPVYLLWDGDKADKDAKAEDNHRLLRLMGQSLSDWPHGVYEGFACFEKDLETTLCEELGPKDFEQSLTECQLELGIAKRKHAIKNPCVIARIVISAQERGCICYTLKAVVERILALRQGF